MRIQAAVISLLLIVAGCAHRADGPAGPDPSVDAPDAGTILAEIHENIHAVASLTINGNVILRLPGEAGDQNFRGGVLQFGYPDQFYMRVRKTGFRVNAYVAGDQFLLDLPYEKKLYRGREGDRFDDALLEVTPARLLREVFLLDLPGAEAAKRTTVATVEGDAEAVALTIRTRKGGPVERRIVAENRTGWRVRSVTVYDGDGAEIVITKCTVYNEYDGVDIPAAVETRFPTYEAKIEYQATRMEYRLQTEPPLAMTSIDDALAELRASGYSEIPGLPRKENEP